MDQSQLNGMTIAIAGIMAPVGNIVNLSILKPVATKSMPPQALKSLMEAGVVCG